MAGWRESGDFAGTFNRHFARRSNREGFDLSGKMFDEGCQYGESSQAAVGLYLAGRRKSVRYPVQCSVTGQIPFTVDVAWRVILETQHLGTWLDDSERGDMALPERFGRGIWLNEESWPTILLDVGHDTVSRGKTLTFQRRFYVDQEPFYFKVRFAPFERFASTMSIEAAGPQVPLNTGVFDRALRWLGNDKTYVDTATIELTTRLTGAIKRFADLVSDRTSYGPSHSDYKHSGRWLVWLYRGDTVNYYANRRGHVGLEIGEYIESGERIGFMKESTGSGDESYWKENNYIEPGAGYIAAVCKEHGGRVQKGDRIVLITNEKNSDLGIADVQITHLDLHLRTSLVVEQYHVGAGDRVEDGQPVATLRYEDGDRSVAVISKYKGTVVELTKAPGERMREQLPWDTVARIRVDRLKC
jgi:hypothetical protein